MTPKDTSLTLATLTFLVQCLVRQQTTRAAGDMRRTIDSRLKEKKVPMYEGLFSFEELEASVKAFLSDFPEL